MSGDSLENLTEEYQGRVTPTGTISPFTILSANVLISVEPVFEHKHITEQRKVLWCSPEESPWADVLGHPVATYLSGTFP